MNIISELKRIRENVFQHLDPLLGWILVSAVAVTYTLFLILITVL